MGSSIQEKWNDVCTRVSSYDGVIPSQFNAFMERVQPQVMNDDFLMITAPNPFQKQYIEKNFLANIKQALKEIYGNDFTVIIEVDEQTAESPAVSAQPSTSVQAPVHEEVAANDIPTTQQNIQPENQGSILQQQKPFSNLTFGNFVIGESNRMAYSMALQVAEMPGNSVLNPLFVYGRSGLGKTHLMLAIKNYINETRPELKVVYVDSQDLVTGYSEAAAQNDVNKSSFNNFKNQYETADVLIIDDVQHLEGRKGTLDIVFQMFNKMINQGRQIVLSADRAPKNIDFEERYASRFLQGGTIDIQPPEVETKLAIIMNYLDNYKKTSGNQDLTLPNDVQMWLAENSGSNIRELQGALNKIFFEMKISNVNEITKSQVATMLENYFLKDMSKNVSIDDIQNEVVKFYNIRHSELVSEGRSRSITYPRHIAMYLCKTLLDIPYNDIGKKFNRDHTSVMHGVSKIEKEINSNREIFEEVEVLKKHIMEI